MFNKAIKGVKDARMNVVAEYYNALAENYDELYGVEQLEKYFKALRFISSCIRDTNKVIDMGCGTALLAQLLKLFNWNGYYLCIDISYSMLSKARNRLTEIGLQYDLLVADIFSPPLRTITSACLVSFTVVTEEKHNIFIKRACNILDKGKLLYTVLFERDLRNSLEVKKRFKIVLSNHEVLDFIDCRENNESSIKR